MVKKTVNQDDPTVYHLFYADEDGSPGADITFFEYPGARRGRAGAGMVHTITFRVASDEALDFWEARLGAEGIATRRGDEPARLRRSRGPRARARRRRDRRRAARRRATPRSRPSTRSRASTACARSPPTRGEPRAARGDARLRPDRRARLGGARRASAAGTTPTIRRRPPGAGVPGAGTVHHVAWASNMDEQEAWLATRARRRAHASGIIDRFWFRSIYFREPSGVLFEIATLGPGFAIDEDAEHLGEALILPPAFEHLRAQIEPVLTPLPDPARGLGRLVTTQLRRLERPAAGRAGGSARAPPRPRRGRARPLPPARRARPGAAAARDHAARPAGAAAGRRPLVPARRASPPPIPARSSRPSRPLAAFLDGLPVPIERVVLGGFSQGAVMSWALGLGARPAAARRRSWRSRASCRRWRASSST